jgi:hypothetical protein
MDNVTQFPGRQQPSQPREPKVLRLGATFGGIRRRCSIVTGYREEIIDVGIDYLIRWEMIAVRDRVTCTYRAPTFPPKTAAVNDR